MTSIPQFILRPTVCILMLLAAGAWAQPTKKFQVDLNGDGKAEKIELRYSGKGESGDYYHLVVLDAEGNSIWSGPKVMDEDNPLVFGSWHFGVSLPQAVGDMDGDGAVELIAPAPQSDVSPTAFRILRWTSNAFKPLKTTIYLATGNNLDRLWSAKSDQYEGRWISAFESIEPGNTATVEITEYHGEGGVKTGKAVVTLDAEGATIQKWIKPLAEYSEPPPPPSAKTPVAPASGNATSPLASYVCQIGIEDMTNSMGSRLKEMHEILLQDRANYHRFKLRHREDKPDEQFFKSSENRQLFAHVPIQATAKAQQTFARGNAILHVTAYADHVEVKLAGE